MEKHRATWISLLLILLPLWMSAQESLKIKDQNGNVLLEAREEGVFVRKMTTAARAAVAGLDADDNGLLVYDSDTKSLWLWHDTGWTEIDGIDLVDDADHDPTNEWQEWITLPGIPAGFLDGTDDVNDADYDPTNELQTWNTLPDKPGGFADGTDDVNDADADPTNELQTWNSLPDKPAGFADGTDDVIDADADPTNELQNWNSLPDKPAGFADGTDDVDDADHDPTNELQDWSNLPGIPTGFMDGMDDVNDADADPTNELQTWNSLPDKPAGFADGTDDVDDADHDPTNESNTALSLTGSVLELTDLGGTLTADLASLMDENDWMVDSGKVYNTGVNVGIGTNTPLAGLHVKGNKGLGEHVMLIENLNHEGSGLQIRIDGSHPLFVTGQGGDPDFFVTHPGAAILDVFEPLADDIRTYLIDSASNINLEDINLTEIASPGGLMDQLGLDDLISGGICKGASTLVDLVNSAGESIISLPGLINLDEDLVDIPYLPEFPTPPSTFVVSLPTISKVLHIGPYDYTFTYDLPNVNVPTGFLSGPVNLYNDALDPVNTGISAVNTALETANDKIRNVVDALNAVDIPLPQLSVPTTIGPITCPDPNPLDDFNFSFEGLNPANYNIVNPLTSENAFITFSDQYDHKLGAITAQGLGEFTMDYFSMEKVLEIGSHVTGLFSDDGNIVENLISLGKDAIAFYKATDKIGVLYSSGHGDYAEWLERENIGETIGYGDIVGVRGGRISLSLEDAEQVMVVSRAPIVLGNIPEPGKEGTGNNVAFIGQVPVKVMGPVQTGDFIIANPATPGYGIAVPEKDITPDQMALAVGKSWETNAALGFKFVNTIVGMHNHGWAVPIQKLQDRIDAQESTLQALTARLDNLEYGSGIAAERKSPKR